MRQDDYDPITGEPTSDDSPSPDQAPPTPPPLPPAPTPYTRPYSPQSPSPYAPQTAATAQKPPSVFDGLPQYRLAQIQDLVNQWEQLVGYSVTVSDSMIANMVKNYGIADLFNVSQYLKQNLGSTWTTMWQQPWAWYGMSATEYNTKTAAYRSTWTELTGTELPGNDGSNIVDQALQQFQGQMSESQFQQWLLSQDSIKNTYGWLKYGLNFNQFQQQKLSMNFAFGRTLSDTEGVTQLQYLHSATGPLMSIANQPTFTQQERKQANVGISGVVAR